MELRDSLAGRIVEVRGGELAVLRKRTHPCTTPSSGTPRRTRCRARSIRSSASVGPAHAARGGTGRLHRARRLVARRLRALRRDRLRHRPRPLAPLAAAPARPRSGRDGRGAPAPGARDPAAAVPPMDRGNAVAARQDGGARGRRHDLRRLPVHGLRRGPGRVGAARGSDVRRLARRCRPRLQRDRQLAMPTYRRDRIRPTGFAWSACACPTLRRAVRRLPRHHLVGLYRTYGRPLAGEPFFNPAEEPMEIAQGEAILRIFSRAACPSSRRISAWCRRS